MTDQAPAPSTEATKLRLSSTIEELLDMTAAQLAALTDEQLEAYLAPSFEVCPPIHALAGVVAIADDEPKVHRLTPATTAGKKLIDTIKAEKQKRVKLSPADLMAQLAKELEL